ncbi:MAG TPA: Mut7-C RNAse domain-containing protein [Spirochaetota bacterium]|nr:Mut7-C RNAse domain-containing protein [Spirochaetota bacterium]HNT12413.1 Mut7-C RNAse domain-containing protein [Spirochaetota bacterium]
MYRITIRFYEELNDFLPRGKRKRDVDVAFPGRRSVKDLIESLGVPHGEVDLVLVNGASVDFSRIVADGDRISVYPVFESLDILPVTRLRTAPLRDTRFVLDVHLRKLARRLRLLGFDVDYRENRGDAELAEISTRERRILLTRDRRLLMRRIVERGVFVRATRIDAQVAEVLDRLDLRGSISPFTRCIECNGRMRSLPIDSPECSPALDAVPPGVRAWCREFHRCDGCGRVYWRGSHYDRLRRVVEALDVPPAGERSADRFKK